MESTSAPSSDGERNDPRYYHGGDRSDGNVRNARVCAAMGRPPDQQQAERRDVNSSHRAFSSEVDTGSSDENASKQKELEPGSDSIRTGNALASHLAQVLLRFGHAER